MKFAIARSLLSLILLPSITVACGGGMGSPALSAPAPVSPTPDPTPPSLPKTWQATDLPPIAGADESQASALNNLGHVVGYSVEGVTAHATLWENGMALDLGANTFANGINDLDQIVGYRVDDSGIPHAHLWPDDIDLGTLSGFDSSVATGINSSGLVVGIAFSSANPNLQNAFTWSPSTQMVAIPGCASAEAVNDSGQVSGIATNLDAAICGVQDFGMSGAAVAINNQGKSVGFSGPDAWLFPTTNIGPTLATGINDNGWVVGYSVGASGGARVRFPVSRVARLHSQVAGVPQPWIWTQQSGIVMLPSLVTANAINKSGQIVGDSVAPDGSTHGALLTAN